MGTVTFFLSTSLALIGDCPRFLPRFLPRSTPLRFAQDDGGRGRKEKDSSDGVMISMRDIYSCDSWIPACAGMTKSGELKVSGTFS